MSPVLTDRLALIETLTLASGSHESLDLGACVMEAVSYIAGEPWSDHPSCACPVITSFMVSWNDALPSNAERDRLLKPLVPMLIDTRLTKAVEERRSYLALDWLVRVFTPKFLDLTPEFFSHAKALRDLDEIVDMAGATAAGHLTRAARWSAESAARSAARSVARSVARSAAESAAWSAAWRSTWSAARSAAESAAGLAARSAAWSAAESAASDFLKPTVDWLQKSAVDLVERMIWVTP